MLKKLLNLELSKNSDGGFSVGLIDDNDFFKWSVCFTGPEDSIYEVIMLLKSKFIREDFSKLF
jgi:ubiquitin-conjugating enzyme E2 G1